MLTTPLALINATPLNRLMLSPAQDSRSSMGLARRYKELGIGVATLGHTQSQPWLDGSGYEKQFTQEGRPGHGELVPNAENHLDGKRNVRSTSIASLLSQGNNTDVAQLGKTKTACNAGDQDAFTIGEMKQCLEYIKKEKQKKQSKKKRQQA
ncbi:hypothetical protein CH63R_14570 [Colletotrichum higginsianum IMI 349063]|uniref:Uncharacterized protein n=1 Tax=Colletotrichum higginsianum (strain IMI 349063) TaxID=759273 RepID=A0A1B7XQG2_COLHI|nr:hypothetical protein CH63R_14570 [Colletotrichum higginsianum IMI 349063]OBR01998.1 hypothetical protein CH63R_14570 [Colletotrichum higginsianum IMI 349063]